MSNNVSVIFESFITHLRDWWKYPIWFRNSKHLYQKMSKGACSIALLSSHLYMMLVPSLLFFHNCKNCQLFGSLIQISTTGLNFPRYPYLEQVLKEIFVKIWCSQVILIIGAKSNFYGYYERVKVWR